MVNANGIIELILIFILPPLAVFLATFFSFFITLQACNQHQSTPLDELILKRTCGMAVCISILLTLLGWIPGAIYAGYYCFCRD